MKKILLFLFLLTIWSSFSLTYSNIAHAQTVGDSCQKAFEDQQKKVNDPTLLYIQWEDNFCYTNASTNLKIYDPKKTEEIKKSAATNINVFPKCEKSFTDTENDFRQLYISKLMPSYPDFQNMACNKNDADKIYYSKWSATTSQGVYNKVLESRPDLKELLTKFVPGNDAVCKASFDNLSTINIKIIINYPIWQSINCTKNTQGEITTSGDYNIQFNSNTKQNSATTNQRVNDELTAKELSCEEFKFFTIPCLVQTFFNLIFTPVSFVLILCARLFDTVLALTLSSTIYNNTAGFVAGLWTLIRDISNIIFLLLLLYIGIMTIIGREKNYKAKVVGVMVSAILVNFSLFYAKLIVDMGNISARIFYKNLDTNISNTSTSSGQMEVKGVSEAVAAKINPQKIVTSYKGNKNLNDVEVSVNIFIAYVLFIVVSFFMIKIFASLFIIFLVRMISLWLLMAMSALPVLFYFIDGPEFKGKLKAAGEYVDFDSWHKQILGISFMPTVFCLFMYFILTLINADLFDYSVGDNTIYALLPVFIMLGIVYILLEQAKSYSEKLAGNIATTITSKIEGAAKFVGGAVLGAAGGAAIGGLGMLGRNVIGAGGEALAARSRSLLSSNNPLGRGLGRLGDKFGSSMANKSYDLRDVKFRGKSLGDRVKTASGGNIDLERNIPFTEGQGYTNMGRGKDGKGGGIAAQRDERRKDRQARDEKEMKYLEVNPSEVIVKNKETKEKEKKKIEDEANKLAGSEENRKKYDENLKSQKDTQKKILKNKKEMSDLETQIVSAKRAGDTALENELNKKIASKKTELAKNKTELRAKKTDNSKITSKADKTSDKIKDKTDLESTGQLKNQMKEKLAALDETIRLESDELNDIKTEISALSAEITLKESSLAGITDKNLKRKVTEDIKKLKAERSKTELQEKELLKTASKNIALKNKYSNGSGGVVDSAVTSDLTDHKSTLNNLKKAKDDLLKAQKDGDVGKMAQHEAEIENFEKDINDFNVLYSDYDAKHKKIAGSLNVVSTEIKEAEKVIKEETAKRFEHYANYVDKYEKYFDGGKAVIAAAITGGATGAIISTVASGIASSLVFEGAVRGSSVWNGPRTASSIVRGDPKMVRNDHDETSRASRAQAIRSKAK